MRPWFSGRIRPCQGRDASSILAGRTNTELNGFFKARRWKAQSASH